MKEAKDYSEKNFSTKIKLEKYLRGYFSKINIEQILNTDKILIDVRTFEEFEKGFIPSALNFPIFDNLERSEIGLIFKNLGQKLAISKGLEFFEPKLKSFLFSISKLSSKELVVYCSRGGMRSEAVTRLLKERGFLVSQLEGGYKAYRNYVLKELQKKVPPLIVLHGQTGVGKTLVLKKLPNHLDLEELAQHRSSLFGAINKIPRSQKNFEAQLLFSLNKIDYSRHLFIEGESSKVGQVFIPPMLANSMKKGIFVLLYASIETRIKRIVEEYQIIDYKSIQQIDSILISMRFALGNDRVRKMRIWLKNGEIESIVRMLLLEYYDPLYLNSMKKYKFTLTLSSEDLELTKRELIRFNNENFRNI